MYLNCRSKLGSLAMSFLLCFVGFSATASTLKVCNKGNVTVSVATVNYRNAFYLFQSWRASGWTNIDAGSCKIVFDSSNDDGQFLTMSYVDSRGVSGLYRLSPGNAGWIDAPSPAPGFCISDKGFNYQTDDRSKLSECSVGFYHMPFTAYFHPSDDASNYTYDVFPAREDAVEEVEAPVREKTAAEREQEAAESERQSAAEMARWVHDDVVQYIVEAQNGHFESYKKGGPSLVSDSQVWNAVFTAKPLLAESCRVVQHNSRNTFACVLSHEDNSASAIKDFTELVDDVRASLPADWTMSSQPPFAEEYASKAFQSATGITGEIWTHCNTGSNRYELNFEVSAAPAR